MAESNYRFTRRKQLMPRRKNVELDSMPEDGDLEALDPRASLSLPSPSDTMVSSATCPDEDDDHPRLVIDQNPSYDSPPTPKDNRTSRDASPDRPSPSGSAIVTTSSNMSSVHDASTLPGTDPSDQASRDLAAGGTPTLQEATLSNGHHKAREDSMSPKLPINGKAEEDLKTEAEKIREYLRRSDTAVIFPEPVDAEDGKESLIPREAPKEALLDYVLKCPHCPRVFKGPRSIRSLRDHLSREHRQLDAEGEMRPIATEVPSTQLCVAERLSVGEGHTEAVRAAFICPKCSAPFAHRDQLEKHELTHQSVPGNQRHMISHDESAVLRKFKCPECGKAFKFKHHLKEHIRIHSGEKPFACPNCNKRFSHSGSYSSHMTSKKCLVVNLKVRKIDLKASRGRAGTNNHLQQHQGTHPLSASHQANAAFRPIIPKYGNSPVTSSPVQDSQNASGINPASFLSDRFSPFVGSTDMSSARHLGQSSNASALQNSLVPPSFLPAAYASVGLSFHTLLANHFQSAGLPPPYVPFAGFSDVSGLLQSSHLNSLALKNALSAERDGRSSVSSEIAQRAPLIDVVKAESSRGPSKELVEPKLEDSGMQRSETEEEKVVIKTEQKDEGASMSPPPICDSSDAQQLNAVKRILKIVDATVSRQQKTSGSTKNGLNQEISNASSIVSASGTGGGFLVDTTADSDSADDKKSSSEDRCRYCDQLCEGKIELHQHERYLCKKNKDHLAGLVQGLAELKQHSLALQPREFNRSQEAIKEAEGLTKSPRSETSDADIEPSEDLASLLRKGPSAELNEESQRYLRSLFTINPRPKKGDIIRLTRELGYPLKAIQTWFHNSRSKARESQNNDRDSPAYGDSALGEHSIHVPLFKPFLHYPGAPAMNGSPKLASPHAGPLTVVTDSSDSSMQLQCLSRNCGNSRRPLVNDALFSAFQETEQPLDLSVKSKNRFSSGSQGSPTSSLTTPELTEGEVLNLSQKSTRHSTLLKDEHGFLKGFNCRDDDKAVSSSPLHYKGDAEFLAHRLQRAGFLMGSHQGNPHLGIYAHHFKNNNHLLSIGRGSASPKMSDSDSHSTSGSPFHEQRNGDSARSSLDYGKYSHRGIHDSSLDGPGRHEAGDNRPASCSDAASMEGTESPDELMGLDKGASPYLTVYEESALGAKNLYKKLWKETDMEESASPMDDSSELYDDLSPSSALQAKRRKTWKGPPGTKADSEDGAYTCDQCDKTFSKQSSLARHKYEHSGQRPHKCEVCSKAFKHKHHLTEHKRLHSGEKPFQCQKCLKRFSHSGSYSQHMNHRYSYCKPYRE